MIENAFSWPDILRLVVTVTKTALPDVWVGDRLPRPDEFDENLPCIVIDLLPGDARHGWGTLEPVMDTVDLDIDVFAASRAEAFELSTRLRQVLYTLPTVGGGIISNIEAPHFTTRPDYNPHIRRLGAVAPLTARN